MKNFLWLEILFKKGCNKKNVFHFGQIYNQTLRLIWKPVNLIEWTFTGLNFVSTQAIK